MAWTSAESDRIATLETVINQLQTAVTNLAAKQQLQQLLILKQAEVDELTSRVEALERMVAILQNAL